MRIVQRLMLCVVASMSLAAGQCMTTTAGTETSRALCQAWRDSLPSRSHSDTPQTQAEIGRGYDVQAAACAGM